MEKSVEGSCQDQHGAKDNSRTSKKRSVVASSKHGAARGTNREKQLGLGDQSDKSRQSNLTQVSKIQPAPVTKRKCQKTVGADPKTPSVYSLRSRDEKSEGSKDSPAYNLRSKIRKTEGQVASTVMQRRKTPRKDGSKDSSVMQKREIPKTELQKSRPLKSSPPPSKNAGITKPPTILMAGHDMNNQPSSSQYKPYILEPMYHIRWEGNGVENGPFGQNCGLCNKDLSHSSEYDDSDVNEDLQYEDDDDDEFDDDDDDDEYYDDPMPSLLPAVDVLSCGHAYHTECLQKHTPEERSSDPHCVLCSGMA